MKYELGDKVKIRKHWKRNNLNDELILQNKSLEEHLSSDDMAGASYNFKKYTKKRLEENGIIVGKRSFKVSAELMWEDEHEIDHGEFGVQFHEAKIIQSDSKYEDVYLVAVGMNCIRKVSFEDIEYLGG